MKKCNVQNNLNAKQATTKTTKLKHFFCRRCWSGYIFFHVTYRYSFNTCWLPSWKFSIVIFVRWSFNSMSSSFFRSLAVCSCCNVADDDVADDNCCCCCAMNRIGSQLSTKKWCALVVCSVLNWIEFSEPRRRVVQRWIISSRRRRRWWRRCHQRCWWREDIARRRRIISTRWKSRQSCATLASPRRRRMRSWTLCKAFSPKRKYRNIVHVYSVRSLNRLLLNKKI